MKVLLFAAFIFFFLLNPHLFAEEPTGVSKRMTRLIEQLDELEKKQQGILTSENKILEEIKGLKIQA